MSRVTNIAAEALISFGLRRILRKIATESCDLLESANPAEISKIIKTTGFTPDSPHASKIKKELKKAYNILQAMGKTRYAKQVIATVKPRHILEYIEAEAHRRAEIGDPRALETLLAFSRNQQASRWLVKQIEEIRKYILEEWSKLEENHEPKTLSIGRLPIMR